MRKLLTLGLILTFTVVLAGCTPANNTTSVVVTDSNGSKATLEGDATDSGAKSSNWPSHIPTPKSASNFSYAKLSDTYYLGYEMNGSASVSAAFAEVKGGLVSAGWASADDSTLETDEAILQNFSRGGDTMILTVSSDGDANKIEVAIIAGPDQSDGGLY